MKLLAGSLDVDVDAFLHAGYLSASGRPFDRMGDHELVRATTNLIDVKRSLELKDTGTQSNQSAQLSTTESPPPAPMPVRASLAGEGFLVGIVLLFFGGLTIHYYWRRLRAGDRPRWRTQLLIILPLLLIAVGTIGVYSVLPMYEAHQLNNRPPPWAGIPRQEYKDPAAATDAIIQALVANALPGCPINVQQLGAIQHEVAFPLPAEQWTPGMIYAAKTYGIDGWGRELKFQPLPKGRFHIGSAGPDGQHYTDDDVVVLTPPTEPYNWEQLVNGVFARRVEHRFTYFVHRVAHRNFRTSRLAEAREVTGTDVFDMLPGRELPTRAGENIEYKPLEQKLEEYELHQDGDVNDDPLIFVQIMRANDA